MSPPDGFLCRPIGLSRESGPHQGAKPSWFRSFVVVKGAVSVATLMVSAGVYSGLGSVAKLLRIEAFI